MRIRKQASKLLGWALSSALPSSPSPPGSAAQYCWQTLPPEADPGELYCQLNRSPWDAIDSPHCTNSQEESDLVKEEEEAVELNAKEDEAKIWDENDEEVSFKDEETDEKGRTRKMRQMELEADPALMSCKKTDGKGWHCKRAAQLPHSLCTYHLAQLRSYRTRYDEQVSRSGVGGRSNRRTKPAAAVKGGGSSSNYYYYYSILGPWWGKRRGPINGNQISESGVSPHETGNKTDGDSPTDHGEEDVDLSRCNDGDRCKKEMPVKKRGRKPMKARSLKSLL